MTIKSRLTLNVVIVLAITTIVVLASVIGMGGVKSKLFDLTERSTPFQTRSMELQRAIHAATADLVKVGSAASEDELKNYRGEAEASLDQVKQAEDALTLLLSGKKSSVYEAVSSQAQELFTVTEGRLKIEEGAVAANLEIRATLKDVSDGLKGLEAKGENPPVEKGLRLWTIPEGDRRDLHPHARRGTFQSAHERPPALDTGTGRREGQTGL